MIIVMGKYLDAIKKISNGSGSELTKPTKLPPNGFVSFVSAHTERLGENISLSDEKISPKHESYALTKLTEPPENGFVGFVSSQAGHFEKNIASSDEKNIPPQIEEITQKLGPYELTKLTQPPENGFVGFVSFQAGHFGKIFESSDEKNAEKNTSTQFEEITPKHGFYALTKLTEPHSEAFHGIEPMTECLHGKPCKWLDCYLCERPGCLKAMDYVFDLDQCPIGAWGPMSPAIVFFED
jgi:hypothetical protein